MTIRVAKIVQYPDERLRQVSRQVAIDDVPTMRTVRDLVFTMLQTMYDARGWGISAIQLGVPARVLAVNTPEQNGTPLIMVNPILCDVSEERSLLVEGCLSFDGLRQQIDRPTTCTVRRWNEFGHYAEPQTFKGWTARAILHELDHLDGRLMVDKMLPAAQRMINRQYTRKAAKRAAKRPQPAAPVSA